MSDYHVFPMQYEPMEGENLRVKVDVDHSTFSVYLKKLDITQMSLHKCVDFAQTILDDVTLTSSSVEPSTSFGQRLSLLSNDKFGKRSQTTWTWTRNPLRTGKKKVRDWILTKCTEDDAAAVLNQLRTWRKPRLATLATIMDNQMYMKKVNSAIPYMSETLDPLDKAEFKRVFFNAHPKPWKDAFLEINGTINSHSVASLTSYMQRKAQQAQDKELKNQLHQKIKSKKKKRTAGALLGRLLLAIWWRVRLSVCSVVRSSSTFISCYTFSSSSCPSPSCSCMPSSFQRSVNVPFSAPTAGL